MTPEQAQHHAELQETAFAALLEHDWATAAQIFAQAYRIKYGLPWNECPSSAAFWQQPLDVSIPTQVSLPKLKHDMEQLQHLMAQDLLPLSEFQTYQYQLAQLYQRLQARLKPEQALQIVSLTADEQALLSSHWNRVFYLEPGNTTEPLLDPTLDWAQLAWQYQHNAPGFAFADQVLNPSALESLRKVCLNSTFWHDFGRGGYVGSYLLDGFCHPLVFRLGAELRAHLPTVLPFPMTLAWSYKYDSAFSGVGLHADSEGRVNVNFWLTPDEANLQPGTGGLVVYDVLAPADWEPAKYQGQLEQFVGPEGFQAYPVPYRQNRMLMFDSRLFHHSGPFQFRPEYTYRRINLTLLFGFQKAALNDQQKQRWPLLNRR